MDPHQTRLVRLLQNGCQDFDVLEEAVTSCIANSEFKLYQSLLQLTPTTTASVTAATSHLAEETQIESGGTGTSGDVVEDQKQSDGVPVQRRGINLSNNNVEGGDEVTNEQSKKKSQGEICSKKKGDTLIGSTSPVVVQESPTGEHQEERTSAVGPLDFPVADSKDMTPLEISVLTQNDVAVGLLLQHGAQPDVVSGLSCSVLCKICYTFPGNINMLRLLLSHGSNPDATTNNDTSSASCLIISVVKDNVEAVSQLLEFGADVSYEWRGSNALSMALDFKKGDIITLLESHEYRRAQDNRWRRFIDRRGIEESRRAQQQALHRQLLLADERTRMLKRNHSCDPMVVVGSHPISSSNNSVGLKKSSPFFGKTNHNSTTSLLLPETLTDTPNEETKRLVECDKKSPPLDVALPEMGALVANKAWTL